MCERLCSCGERDSKRGREGEQREWCVIKADRGETSSPAVTNGGSSSISAGPLATYLTNKGSEEWRYAFEKIKPDLMYLLTTRQGMEKNPACMCMFHFFFLFLIRHRILEVVYTAQDPYINLFQGDVDIFSAMILRIRSDRFRCNNWIMTKSQKKKKKCKCRNDITKTTTTKEINISYKSESRFVTLSHYLFTNLLFWKNQMNESEISQQSSSGNRWRLVLTNISWQSCHGFRSMWLLETCCKTECVEGCTFSDPLLKI